MKVKNKKWLLVTGYWLLVTCHFLMACDGSKADSKLINSQPLGQQMAVLRKDITVLLISGIPITDIRFNAPQELKFLENKKAGVFHPEGGGAEFPVPPAEYMAENFDQSWVFNGELEISGIERDDIEGHSEIIAYLIGIKKDRCLGINEINSIQGIPQLQSDQSKLYTKNMIDSEAGSYSLPQGRQPSLDHSSFIEQPFGCFEDYKGGTYVYYHLITER